MSADLLPRARTARETAMHFETTRSGAGEVPTMSAVVSGPLVSHRAGNERFFVGPRTSTCSLHQSRSSCVRNRLRHFSWLVVPLLAP